MAGKNKTPEWLKSLEKHIEKGQGQKVREKLLQMQNRGVPSHLVVEVARLAHRVGMYHFATNILFPMANSETSAPSEEVIVEYAKSCAGVGNYMEAREFYARLPESVLEQHTLPYIDCLFRNWEYAEAQNILKKQFPSRLDDYMDLVLGLNLSSSYLATGDYGKAEKVLNKVDTVAVKNNHTVIHANCLEMLGQIDHFSGQFKEAIKKFETSEELLRNSQNLSWLFAFKRLHYSRLAQNPTEKNRKSLVTVRQKAREFVHWETLRDCDLFEAVHTENQELFNRVYHATPNPVFREMALNLSGNQFDLHPEVSIGPRGRKKWKLNLDVVDFHPDELGSALKSNQRRAIVSLLSDLYSPRSIYQVFREVYDEPHFNPVTSKDKTYKLIQKLRKVLANHPTSCTVENSRSYGYRLRAGQPLMIVYPAADGQNHRIVSPELNALKTHLGDQFFTQKQAIEVLGKPSRTTGRWLKTMVDDGALEKTGQGKGTRYRVKSSG